MKRYRRKTLRTVIGIHIDFLNDLIGQLDAGARPEKVIAEWKRDCGAVKDLESLFMESPKAARS